MKKKINNCNKWNKINQLYEISLFIIFAKQQKYLENFMVKQLMSLECDSVCIFFCNTINKFEIRKYFY